MHARAPQHDLVGGRQAAELQPAAAGQASPQEKRLALGLCLPSNCTSPRCSTQARTAHRLLCRSSRAHTVSARTAQARSAQQPTVAPFDGAQSQGATGGAVPRQPPRVPSNASIKQLPIKAPTHGRGRPQGPTQQYTACLRWPHPRAAPQARRQAQAVQALLPYTYRCLATNGTGHICQSLWRRVAGTSCMWLNRPPNSVFA